MTSSPRTRRIGRLLGAIYLLALAAIALSPQNVDSRIYPALLRTLDRLQELGAPHWFSYTVVEFGANVLLFLPLGALVVLLLGPRRWFWAIPIGFGCSAGIELAQALFLSSRVSSSRDVLANGSGALLGALLTVLVLAIARRRRPGAPQSVV